MTTAQIIAKANEVVRGASFTKVMKVRKNAGVAFLIVSCGNGLAFYGSYTSDSVYAEYNGQMVKLA